jgi:GNAT superfamily N-acetyltransferase
VHSFLRYALSTSTPLGAARSELESLYPVIDDRWNQKIDRARCIVSVYDSHLLIAAGIVHDSVIAPTSVMGALELGCMSVRPEYRRRGIRQQVTELRLDFVLKTGCTPITVIDSANPGSWAAYERSDVWERERSFDYQGQTKYIYRAVPALTEHPATTLDVELPLLTAPRNSTPLPAAWGFDEPSEVKQMS